MLSLALQASAKQNGNQKSGQAGWLITSKSDTNLASSSDCTTDKKYSVQIAHKVRDYQRQKTVYREGDEDSDWVAIDTGNHITPYPTCAPSREGAYSRTTYGRHSTASLSEEPSVP